MRLFCMFECLVCLFEFVVVGFGLVRLVCVV